MKKLCIVLAVIGIIILSIGAYKKNSVRTEYLRIHVRANSNEDVDQEVKYKVKDAVVEFLTPVISTCDTEKKAEDELKQALGGIEAVADKVLKENGLNYTCKAAVKSEEFPTRKYDDLTLEAGVYRALILYLGEGTGDNWWCVVYPPLCFTGTGDIKYKSKIVEIIKDFKEKRAGSN